MKTILAFLFVVVSSTLGFAQSIDDLIDKPAPKGLTPTESRYNAGQNRSRLSLVNRRVVVRITTENVTLDDGDLANIEEAFFAAGAAPVLDLEGLMAESEERRWERSNDEIKQSTVPGKGKLVVGDLVAEVNVRLSNRRDDLSAFWGSFFRGGDFGLSKESWTTMITCRLRDKESGTTVGILKVSHTASSTDNIGGQILSGFGRQIGVDIRSEDEAGRVQRSFDVGVEKLGKLLGWRYA